MLTSMLVLGLLLAPAWALADFGYGGGDVVSGPQSYGYQVGSTGSTGTNAGSAPSQGVVLGASTYNFRFNIQYRDRGTDVMELQKILIADGYLAIAAPTGWFGPMTYLAVKEYQKENTISPISGFVGPLTRGVLNQGI